MRREPRTRAEVEGVNVESRIDPNTGEPYPAAINSAGRVIDKNRSETGVGYKSHLTPRQLRLIRWALRQRDRGISRARVLEAVKEKGWEPGPMQYPITWGTITSWELTRKAMKARGRVWPPESRDSVNAPDTE
jgi:hypothetical protein